MFYNQNFDKEYRFYDKSKYTVLTSLVQWVNCSSYQRLYLYSALLSI